MKYTSRKKSWICVYSYWQSKYLCEGQPCLTLNLSTLPRRFQTL